MGDSLLTTDGKIPVKNLAEVAMFQQQINEARCACTRTGYSGVTLEDDGTLLTYGNTSFVGCGEFANGELSGELMACYIVGGVDCEVATPSELEGDEFSMAAYRECTPLQEKGFFKDFFTQGAKFMEAFSKENNFAMFNVGCFISIVSC